MRKILLIFCIIVFSCSQAFAAKIPSEVIEYINNNVPGTDIRFDGVVILPDNTIYLPLFPSLFSDVNKLQIKQAFPTNGNLKSKADIIIFNNDFVLMKVISNSQGHKTVLHQTNPPLQVRTGLLPQDMLVPSGLVLPENIKGIIGNLKIDTKNEDIIKSTDKESFEELMDMPVNNQSQGIIPQLKNKVLFVITNYSKNIQVVEPAHASPSYSLVQKSIPIDIKAVNNGKFILVTSHDRPFIDVISVADSRFIKQIDLPTFPSEIVVDKDKNIAYVTSPSASTIFVIDLKTMSLAQKIKVNGYCEKLLLKDNKIFYVDKLNNEVWAIELENEYTLKDIGTFPNISSLQFSNNKLYLASRTKSRVAVVDYNTLGLISEFTTVNKPVKMKLYKNYIYILGAQNNEIEIYDINANKSNGKIPLSSDGFSTGFNEIEGTNLAVISDVKTNKYSIIDLSSNKLLKTYSINVPVNDIIITNKVDLFK